MALLVWLPLTQDLRNNGTSGATFSYINNNGKLGKSTSGKLGNCYERTASGYADLYRSSIKFNLSGDITMACWAYVSATVGSTANGLITNHDANTNSGVGINVKYMSDSDFRICCSTGTGTGRTYMNYYGTTNIKDSWHHLALTYNKSAQTLKLWVDGVAEYTLTGYANGSASNPFDLFNWSTGNYTNTNYRPVCKLNDVRLYDDCLSDKEIKELAKGLVCHYPLNDTDIEATTNLVTSLTKGGQTTVNGLTVTTSGVDSDTYFFLNLSEAITTGTTYTLSMDATGILDGTNWHFRLKSLATFDFTIRQGHNEYTFTATSDLNGITKLLLDDSSRSGWANPATFFHIQLEKKDHATNYVIGSRTGRTITYDASGNGYNLINAGTLTTQKDSIRYNRSTYFDADANYMSCTSPTAEMKTVSFWLYLITAPSSAAYQVAFADYKSKLAFGISASNTKAIYVSCNDLNTYPYITSTALPVNQWYHFVVTKNTANTDINLYVNGEKFTSRLSSSSSKWTHNTDTLILGERVNTTPTSSIKGCISDFRGYATILSDDDIKDLYQTRASIANNGTILGYEFNEVLLAPRVLTNGTVQCSNFSNFIVNTIDKNVYIEPDGSAWIRIVHHNNPANVKFASTDTFSSIVNTDSDRWFNASLCNRVGIGQWELMIKQKTTSGGTEAKYRWIQSYNPMTATYAQTTAANVTKITTSGYSTHANYGGAYYYNTNSYLVCNNSVSGNWYGALGAWNMYNGGVPGYAGVIITTGYMDLYLRVDNDPQLSASFLYNSIIAKDFIEI